MRYEQMDLMGYYKDIKSGKVVLTYQDFKKRAINTDIMYNLQHGHILRALFWGVKLIFTVKRAFNKFKNIVERNLSEQ